MNAPITEDTPSTTMGLHMRLIDMGIDSRVRREEIIASARAKHPRMADRKLFANIIAETSLMIPDAKFRIVGAEPVPEPPAMTYCGIAYSEGGYPLLDIEQAADRTGWSAESLLAMYRVMFPAGELAVRAQAAVSAKA
jgi:hypothetical protein